MSSYERLSAEDRLFLDIEDGDTHMHVAAVFVFEAAPVTCPDGGLDFERICDYVASRLYRIPRYRQCIRYTPLERHPIWVDDETFNIQYHVRHTRLPLPGDERQLKRLCGRIISQQLDTGKPLWEMWVVEGLENDRFAVITKTHHCMVDGVAGIDLVQTLLSLEPAKTFEPPPAWMPRPAPPARLMLSDDLAKRFRMPLSFGGALLDTLRDPRSAGSSMSEVLEGLREARALVESPVAATPLNQHVGPHRRYDWLVFDLAEVKHVRRSLGGTINDVVLAVVAGALGRFLEQRGITLREQAGMEFRVACPVNTRDGSERGGMGNHVSMLIIPLPIEQRDPGARLEAVIEAMERAKGSKQVAAMQSLTSLGEWTSPALVAEFARRNMGSQTSNLVVTNVPGPQTRLYLLEAPMSECYPVVPLMQGHSLGIALFSYDGGLYWGFNANWELLPDLHEFVLAMNASFLELSQLAGGVGNSEDAQP